MCSPGSSTTPGSASGWGRRPASGSWPSARGPRTGVAIAASTSGWAPPERPAMTGSAAPVEGYRPDVDGLRAVAVLSVLAFHLDRRFLPGGFVGVDIFFVISRFLITRI